MSINVWWAAGKKNSVRLMELAEIDDCGKGIRFYGDYLREDRAIVFDLAVNAVIDQ